jgi:hypothetical protein
MNKIKGIYVIKFKYYFLSVLSPVTDIRVRGFSIQLIDIKGDAHLSNAKRYPQLTHAIGVHSDDWTLCKKGT